MNDFVSVLIALGFVASVNLFPESRSPSTAEGAPCSCPVVYSVKPILPTLYNQWRFVGFVDNRKDTIQPPVCKDTITLGITNEGYKGIGTSYFRHGFDGSSGANQFWGTYRVVDHETIEFSPVLTTGRANLDCKMAFEKRYLTAISGRELKYQLRNNLLELELDENRRMRFVLME